MKNLRYLPLALLFAGQNAFAQATPGPTSGGYSIGTSGGTGFIAQLEALMQSWINFVSGPLGVAVCVIAFVIAAILWVFAPRSGAVGMAVRAIAAVIVIFNLGSIVAAFVLP